MEKILHRNGSCIVFDEVIGGGSFDLNPATIIDVIHWPPYSRLAPEAGLRLSGFKTQGALLLRERVLGFRQNGSQLFFGEL